MMWTKKFTRNAFDIPTDCTEKILYLLISKLWGSEKETCFEHTHGGRNWYCVKVLQTDLCDLKSAKYWCY